MKSPPPTSARPAPAFVLLTVLVIVMLASMLAASLLFALRADVTAQAAGTHQEQAWATARSGIARALAVAQASSRGLPDWSDNAAAFQHQFVAEDGDDRWYFSVYSDSESLAGDLRFGLTDEAGKLSLTHANPAWIARLPGLDETRTHSPTSGEAPPAPATPDGSVSPSNPTTTPGSSTTAPRPETSGAPDPATPATALSTATATPATPARVATADAAPSLDEAFARAGFRSALLYGEDTNFNLRLDPNEDDGDTSAPLDDRNGLLDAGLQRFLTVDSYDLNVDSQGRPRVNLNDPRADLSGLGLPPAALDYLAARRRANRPLTHPVELLGAEDDLPDASGKTAPLASGIGKDEIATVLDRCTATDETHLPGLINLNTAPAAVLAALPALGESGADAVLAARPGLGVEDRRTPAWILQRGLVTADQFKELAPHLTTRGFQFTFRCVGYAVPSGRYRVLAATIDTATQPPRILAVRDLTRFGFPVPLELLETAGP